MTTRFKLRVMMAILAIALPTCPAGVGLANVNNQAPNSADAWGPPTEGFALSVEVIEGPSGQGNGPQLKCVLKNVSRRVLQFVVGSPEKECMVTVSNDKGERVSVSKSGEQILRSRGDYLLHYVERLYPRQQYEEIYPLASIYNLSTPGRYTVKVERSVPKRGWRGWTTVQSPPIQINLVAK